MKITKHLFTYFCIGLFACLMIVASGTITQAKQVTEENSISIEHLQEELAQIPESSVDNADLQAQTAKLAQIRQSAQLLLASVTQQVIDLEAKLNSISTPASAAGNVQADTESPPSTESSADEPAADSKDIVPEAAFVAEQRSALQKERDRLDATRKQLILIISEAEEKSKNLVAERRQRFKDELSLKVQSVLSPAFWANWSSALPSDAARFGKFVDEVSGISQQAISTSNRVPTLIGVIFSLLGLFLLKPYLFKSLNFALVNIIPTGRARRSFLAAGTIFIRVFVISMAAFILYQGLNWHNILSPEFSAYLYRLFKALVLSAFVYGVGEAILCIPRPSWRLVSLSDAQAQALSKAPLIFALLIFFFQLITETATYIGSSFIHELSVKTWFTLIASVLAMVFFTRISKRSASTEENKDIIRPVWLMALFGLAWLTTILAIIFTLLGYVSFGSFLINQLIWTTLILAAFYICWKLADDVYQAILGPEARLGKLLINTYGFSENTLNQIIVVLAAMTKLSLMYFLLKTLLLPFGTSITQLLVGSTYLNELLNKNAFAITSGSIISAILVFFIGFWLIRLFKSWLDKRYFPNTSLEKGVQSSISTMSGYLGGVAVIGISLGTLGLSFDKITWVASALSVGIGFGLQSIVQNFISGLILLTERPVKVGDWVIVGTDDGDIKRINIRATEIQLADRSTLIVPNSEFITKAVRNMTLDKSEGRVQIKLPLPISTNPRTVADMILAVFAEHESVIKEMVPFIRLDSVDTSNLILSATCYVPSPRMVGQVRTELLFEILDRLHKANITLISPVHISQVAQPATTADDDLSLFKT